jgi:hypothetical protein
MLARFEQEDYLGQDEAADLLSDTGGDELLTTNDNGNIAITKTVLAEFQRLTVETAIWMKSERAWRLRDPKTDPPGIREQPL